MNNYGVQFTLFASIQCHHNYFMNNYSAQFSIRFIDQEAMTSAVEKEA
jgi:hypothetical protein